MIRSTKDTPQKTSVITCLFRTDCSLQLETLILSMKANANRKHTKLDNKAFILFVLLLSYLVNFTACSFFDFKKQFSLTEEVNLKIKELILKKLTSEQFPQKMMLICSFCGAAWLMMWQNFRRISEIS